MTAGIPTIAPDQYDRRDQDQLRTSIDRTFTDVQTLIENTVTRLNEVEGVQRTLAGGLIISEPNGSDRFVSMTEGVVYRGFTRLGLPSFTTEGAVPPAVLRTHIFFNSSGDRVEVADNDRWASSSTFGGASSTHWLFNNTGTGLLEQIPVTRYSNFFYAVLNNGQVIGVFDDNHYVDETTAHDAPEPVNFDPLLGRLISRLTFLQGGVQALSIDSLWP